FRSLLAHEVSLVSSPQEDPRGLRALRRREQRLAQMRALSRHRAKRARIAKEHAERRGVAERARDRLSRIQVRDAHPVARDLLPGKVMAFGEPAFEHANAPTFEKLLDSRALGTERHEQTSIVEEILLEELDLLLRERMGRPRDDDHRRVARHAALAKELELARLVAGGLEVARDRAQHRARAAQRGLTVTLGEVDALSLALGELHDRPDHRLLTAERADRSRDRDVAR